MESSTTTHGRFARGQATLALQKPEFDQPNAALPSAVSHSNASGLSNARIVSFDDKHPGVVHQMADHDVAKCGVTVWHPAAKWQTTSGPVTCLRRECRS